MRLLLLIVLQFALVGTVQAQLLTDAERKERFGQWTFRPGIWEDQWDFYSPQWFSQNKVDESLVPDNWVSFRDANSGDRDGDGQRDGTTELFQEYRTFVNQQADTYQQNNIPIDGGLGILAALGLGFGIYTQRKNNQ
jgi:hypothetical protein